MATHRNEENEMTRYSVSVQMRGSVKVTKAMTILANSPEDAFALISHNVDMIYGAACRAEGAEYFVSVCDPDNDFDISHFQNFED
jgi:hypothetical protein